MFGASPPPPPPAPPPPGNPPVFANAMKGTPGSAQTPGLYGGLGSSILTSPFGAPASGQVERKSLLGQ